MSKNKRSKSQQILQAAQKNKMITFKTKASQKIIYQYINAKQSTFRRLNQSWYWTVRFSDQQFPLRTYAHFFSMIHTTKCTTMNVQNFPYDKFQPLMRNIPVPEYEKMFELRLLGCQIRNIQFLTFINAPHLRTLRIIRSQVFMLKSLDKLIYSLDQVYIFENYHREMNLSRVSMDRDKKFFLVLRDVKLNNNISILAKLKLSNIMISNIEGISSGGQKLQESIKRKSREGNFTLWFPY